ncbi:hypothetical protein [Candidatus Nitrospira neomarina]|uniref:Uncharacterized protein n=1 Tax=Candidatus Nitrospira neomarina TaxID=3020899 RepID=A0AA96GJK4_9BACT|nr:hypothetical protein [Candidatus Nitrospira neomarina]WNM62512.1 hypothetical protein PQG83_01845 [Candidatus Nitrospira neomarina]
MFIGIDVAEQVDADAGLGVMDRPPECPTSPRGFLASALNNQVSGRAVFRELEMLETSCLVESKTFDLYSPHM